jgi:hypothetical protein
MAAEVVQSHDHPKDRKHTLKTLLVGERLRTNTTNESLV